MTGALVSTRFVARFGGAMKRVAERAGTSVEFVTLPGQRARGEPMFNVQDVATLKVSV